MKLILASASPRRAEILRDAGISFDVLPVNVDETPRVGESAEAMCRRLAEAKARAAVANLGAASEPTIVVAADTTVEIDGEILGKPDSPEAARAMLRRLSGRTHRVLTALSLIRSPDGAVRSDLESTAVRFATLSAEEIDEYVATGEPMDKAGAYGIQGRAGVFIERVEGCYFNVVGLPLARLYRSLRQLGWSPSPRSGRK
jgi:septum formation protein